MGENPAVPEANVHVPATPAVRFLGKLSPARFTATAVFGTIPLWPNLAMRFGLFDARGYDYPVEDRYLSLWEHSVAPPKGFGPPALFSSINPTSLRALNLFGVRSILTPPGDPAPRGPGIRLAYRGRDARIYDNPHALPRTFVVAGAQTVAGKTQALDAVTAPSFDPTRSAIVEKPVPGLTAYPPPYPVGRATLTHYGSESLTIHARSAAPGLVVLSDTWFPGWKATVDGRPAPIARVDYFMRGVRIAAGDHVVTMRYRPASVRIGWIVTLLALAVWLGLLAYGLKLHTRIARARYSRRS
jgi:hypothetical protein